MLWAGAGKDAGSQESRISTKIQSVDQAKKLWYDSVQFSENI